MALVRFPREGMCQSQETDAERIQGAYSDFTNFTSTHVSGLVVQNPPANAGDIRDAGSIPGSGRSPGGGPGNPLQYSCLENFMNKGGWWATVRGVTKSWTRLKQLSTQADCPMPILSD